jgi:UDP-MurNAc hydroxylase
VPGTQVDLDGGELTVTQTLYTPAEIDHIFDEKWDYLASQRDSARTRSPPRSRAGADLPPEEMLAAIKEWWEPLLRARTIRTGVGGNVRFRIGELDMVVDFPKAKVREYAGRSASTGTRSPPTSSRRTSPITRSTGRTRSSCRCSSRWVARASSTSS